MKRSTMFLLLMFFLPGGLLLAGIYGAIYGHLYHAEKELEKKELEKKGK